MRNSEHIEELLEKYTQGAPLTDRTTLCLLLALLLTVGETPFLFMPLQYYIAVHATLSLALCVLILVGRKKHWDMRYFSILAALFIPMGPIGGITTVVSMVLYTIYLRTKTPLVELLQALYPEEKESDTEILYERIATGLEDLNPKTKPIPFQDIMTYGTTAQKRNAIEKILRFYRPDFASALFLGIRDPENGIRILSATAITRLDSQYMNHFQQLQKKVENQPENPDVLLDFAKHCDACSNAGVLDIDRAQKMRTLAIKGYEQYCEMVPGRVDVILALGRISYQNGDYKKACDWLRMVIRMSETVPMSTFKWLLSAIFKMKEYGFIRKISKKVAEDPRSNYDEATELSEYIHFWLEENATKVTP